MREHASAFLSGVSGQPDSPIAGVAHRISGIYSWYVGDLIDARTHLEKALAISDPSAIVDLAFRFGHDPRISASVQLGVVFWLLGRSFARPSCSKNRGVDPHVSHVGTIAQGNLHAAMFEVMRGNHVRAAEVIRALAAWHTNTIWRCGRRWLFPRGLVDVARGRSKCRPQCKCAQASLNSLTRDHSLFGGLIRPSLLRRKRKAAKSMQALSRSKMRLRTANASGNGG